MLGSIPKIVNHLEETIRMKVGKVVREYSYKVYLPR